MHQESRGDGTRARRPADVLLLVLNVAIVIAGLSIVWVKWRDRAGLAEPETPLLDTRQGAGDSSVGDGASPPLPIAPRAGASGATPLPNESSGDGPGTAAIGEVVEIDQPRTDTAADPGEWTTDSDPGARTLRVRGRVDGTTAPPGPPTPLERAPPAALHALAATESLIDAIGVDLEVLRGFRDAYPTSAVDQYGTNRGIEALHVALAKVGKTDGLRLGDTDDDGRLEILDAWGRPLVYFGPGDYASTQLWAPGDSDAVELGACRATGAGAYQAAGSFQLFSVGPDGRVGGGLGDDVTSWVPRD